MLLVLGLQAEELNIKFASYVKHNIEVGYDFNEGFKNHAKGIEYIHTVDKNHGYGLTYMDFYNSYYQKTVAKGFVYKYTSDEIIEGLHSNVKLYALHQKGYYGDWTNLKGWASKPGESNQFWAPMMSAGIDYHGLTFDFVGTPDSLYAVTVGYSFKFNAPF